MSDSQIRGNDLAQMKGAWAWLTSLPLAEEGYVLNKREYFDDIRHRELFNLLKQMYMMTLEKNVKVINQV